MFNFEDDKIGHREINNNFFEEDGFNNLLINDFRFLPSYEIKFTDDSKKNMKKLKQDNIDIFKNISSENEESLDLDFDKLS
jgi:hypothetical protein